MSQHSHNYNRWVVTRRCWQCICGAVLSEAEAANGSTPEPSASVAPSTSLAQPMFSEGQMFTSHDLDTITKPLHAEIERLHAGIETLIKDCYMVMASDLRAVLEASRPRPTPQEPT
jgi:hypothetical protein